MNVTTLPVGTTGQFLEGVAVSTGVRESVILTSPTDPDGFAEIVSTKPVSQYGLPTWAQGTTEVFGAVSTQIVSSIPFYVSQSSNPWTVNGGIAVTNVPTVNVTNVPLVTVQGTSSVNVLNVPTVNVTNVPLVTVQGTSSVNVISSVAHAISGTVSTQIVSSIPFFVAQSTSIWPCAETVSTSGGTNATTLCFAANLNTTIVKASAGQVYGVMGTNQGSSNVYVRFFATSTAPIASTAVPKMIFGMTVSTNPSSMFDVGVSFSTGIAILTQQQPFTATSALAPTASTAVITIFYA